MDLKQQHEGIYELLVLGVSSAFKSKTATFLKAKSHKFTGLILGKPSDKSLDS